MLKKSLLMLSLVVYFMTAAFADDCLTCTVGTPKVPGDKVYKLKGQVVTQDEYEYKVCSLFATSLDLNPQTGLINVEKFFQEELGTKKDRRANFETNKKIVTNWWNQDGRFIQCPSSNSIACVTGYPPIYCTLKSGHELALKLMTQAYGMTGDELNFPSVTDGKTVLDFVEDQITKFASYPEMLAQYKKMRDMLIANGAKRSSELPKKS